jgi:hypothetical protein
MAELGPALREAGSGPTAQGTEFLSNYRLGKTLGVGSFGKVRNATSAPSRTSLLKQSAVIAAGSCMHWLPQHPPSFPPPMPMSLSSRPSVPRWRHSMPLPCSLPLVPLVPQVKVAEHVVTGHRVAIKILNRKKIQAMDMDEKGRRGVTLDFGAAAIIVPPHARTSLTLPLSLPLCGLACTQSAERSRSSASSCTRTSSACMKSSKRPLTFTS